jgi:hypothetical protein
MEGKRSPITDGRKFLAGTLADRCMRRGLEEGKFEPKFMHKFLDDEWDTNTGKEAEYKIGWKGNVSDDQKAILTKVRKSLDALEPIILEYVAPYTYKPEYRFRSVIGVPDVQGERVDITVMGAVDVAVLFGIDEETGFGRYGLFDLKITENDTYIKSTLAQLTFYDIAFMGWTGVRPVQHAFWTPLLSQKIIPVKVTDIERRQMYSRIIDYCQNVWAGRWELTQNIKECYDCPVKHACPRWVTPITKDAQGKNRASFSRASFDTMQEEALDEL